MRVPDIRILLVEDDDELAARVQKTLVGGGFDVERAEDGERGWFLGSTNSYDAVILDLGLPIMSGLDVLKKWRNSGIDLPVIILTVRNSWSERVRGLNAGADDYLAKPFYSEELIARVNAVLRRQRSTGSSQGFAVGEFSIDPSAGAACRGDQTIPLTGTEVKILKFLHERRGRVIQQSDLVSEIYDSEDARGSNTIEVYVARLRRKLGKNIIKTVRGFGYQISE